MNVRRSECGVTAPIGSSRVSFASATAGARKRRRTFEGPSRCPSPVGKTQIVRLGVSGPGPVLAEQLAEGRGQVDLSNPQCRSPTPPFRLGSTGRRSARRSRPRRSDRQSRRPRGSGRTPTAFRGPAGARPDPIPPSPPACAAACRETAAAVPRPRSRGHSPAAGSGCRSRHRPSPGERRGRAPASSCSPLRRRRAHVTALGDHRLAAFAHKRLGSGFLDGGELLRGDDADLHRLGGAFALQTLRAVRPRASRCGLAVPLPLPRLFLQLGQPRRGIGNDRTFSASPAATRFTSCPQ